MDTRLTITLVSILLPLSIPSPASAAESAMTTPAHYRGRMIDLSKGWQGAKACAVLPREIRCYDSEREQQRDVARRLPPPVSGPSASQETTVYCLNRSDLGLTVYSNTSFGGSSLTLYSADVWHNLSALSFDNVTSSWRNSTYCDATAATDASGGGSTITWGARSQNADVGATWNDVVSSVFIDA